jgi:hypothetical protein
MKIILYICIWIVGIDPPMKVETRTPRPDTFVRESLKTGIMKTLKLTQGQFALVDDEDYDFLMQWKWSVLGNKKFYAGRMYKTDGKFKRILLHREIMQTPKGMEVDHIDHDGLNCQKSNMRNCFYYQNRKNRSPSNKTSPFLGVCYDRKYIKASIHVDKKTLFLGNFKTEVEAAHAYDEAAKLYHGEFANLNFKD